ncbi:hypothetical protein CTI12_AA096160 [Artemisia annua]|uniref:ATPase AAA-type core domain-containing protein n=1 Tax=Artemisia annua TaxID=35608 RepID=A0A2U1PYN6_ARTAN|nr:hypothetical protein CTI12_AA096160 [Artemisia annua]
MVRKNKARRCPIWELKEMAVDMGSEIERNDTGAIIFPGIFASTEAICAFVHGRCEVIQKYLGEGPRLFRELLRVVNYLSPSIVFIDEIDVFGTQSMMPQSGGECEIQRTMLELSNQLDDFDSRGDVKVVLATNIIESLYPALLRPVCIDMKMSFNS